MNKDALSKARTFGIISLVFGLIAPGLIVAAFLVFVVLAAVTAGFGVLGLIAVFELGFPVLSFFVAIPLGIVAIIFAVKALSTIKPLQASRKLYVFSLCLGIFNVVLPILLAWWLIPPGACIYDRNPGNAGCLVMPIVPMSWQVSPQYLKQLQTEENAPAQPSVTYPAPPQAETYTNTQYGFSFTYPANFSLSIESSTDSILKSITVQETNAKDVSAILFINQPYPTNEKAGAVGISTVGFNASGSLWETNYTGASAYSPSGTYNPFISGYALTSQFTDSRGNAYYWKNTFTNSNENRDGSLIVFSMQTL